MLYRYKAHRPGFPCGQYTHGLMPVGEILASNSMLTSVNDSRCMTDLVGSPSDMMSLNNEIPKYCEKKQHAQP